MSVMAIFIIEDTFLTDRLWVNKTGNKAAWTTAGAAKAAWAKANVSVSEEGEILRPKFDDQGRYKLRRLAAGTALRFGTIVDA